MAKKKVAVKPKEEDLGVCSNCWRYSAFKNECMYFWESKSECSKFLRHQLDEERHVRKGLFE